MKVDRSKITYTVSDPALGAVLLFGHNSHFITGAALQRLADNGFLTAYPHRYPA